MKLQCDESEDLTPVIIPSSEIHMKAPYGRYSWVNGKLSVLIMIPVYYDHDENVVTLATADRWLYSLTTNIISEKSCKQYETFVQY